MGERLAVFDLDGTLLAGSKSVIPELAYSLWKAGFRRPAGVPRFAMAGLVVVARKLRLVSRERYTEAGTRLVLTWMADKRLAEMVPYFEETARQLLQKTIRETTAAEIKLRQQEGFRTVILSATIQPFLAEIAKQLECEAIGTPIALTPDGRITGALAGPYCSGPAKLQALRDWASQWQAVDWQGSMAYGDTLPDLSVLEAVGTPVAVAPEPSLRHLATDRGWRIIDA